VKRKFLAVSALGVVAGLLAACGSSGSSGSPSSPGSSGSATAPASAAAPASSGSVSKGLAEAKSLVAAAEAQPAKIPLTKALSARPQAGQTYVWMGCNVGTCTAINQAQKAATEAAGWKFVEISYNQSDPSTLVTGMTDALRYHPAAVGVSGLPEAVWASVVPSYTAAGVPIVVSFVGPQQLSKTIIANISGPKTAGTFAATLGDWFVADSQGAGKTLFVYSPTYPINVSMSDALHSEVSRVCPACSVQNLGLTYAQIASGGVNDAIVAALRRDPSIKYVLSAFGAAIAGLPASLSAAGLSDIKVGTLAPSTENLTLIKAGTEQAAIGSPNYYFSWLSVDAAIRHSLGDPQIPEDGGATSWLITKSSTFDITESQDPVGFENQMRALWNVGS
jgi:ribose transport system substrate-binding protein